jgi:hypothetical protein
MKVNYVVTGDAAKNAFGSSVHADMESGLALS